MHRAEPWNECLLLRPQSQSSTRSASHLACSTGVLLVRANVKSSQSFIRPAVWFGVRVDGGCRGRAKGENLHFPTPTPLLIFDRRPPFRYKFPSLPQSSAAIQIKDGGHNISQENTKHSPAKIAPALQATSHHFFSAFSFWTIAEKKGLFVVYITT